MSRISTYLASALMIIALTVGVGIGYYLTPQYQLSMYDKTAMDLGPADKWFDLRYINAMIAHHRGAILLAQQATGSQRSEISGLAKEIQQNEPALIQELYDWKEEWYNDTRLVTDPIAPQLGAYDEKFDLRFLNALIAHHEAGIVMTENARSKASRTEILNNADAVELFLKTTGEALKAWRTQWYNL